MAVVAGSPWHTAEARDQDRVLKREAVLQAAVRSFNEYGFRTTSLEEIATSLGVTKPTLYNYFASKDEILFECARRGLEAIRDSVSEMEGRGGTGRDRLHALLQGYAMVMTQEFGMCVIRTADHELSPASRRKLRDMKREIDRTVRGVIEAGVEDGSLWTDDAQLATFTLAGALNWIARWYDPFGSRTAEEVAQKVATTLLAGLIPHDTPMAEGKMP